MAEPTDRTDEAALWRRWRSAAVSVDAAGVAPDASLLAAYAEDSLPEKAVEAIENWLAVHPEMVSDILAARRAARTESPAPSPAVVARAIALVAAGDAQVLAFRRPAGRRASWRAVALWSGMAASLVVTSLIGFALGNSAYLSLAGGASPAFGQELFDPPTGLFNSLDEEPST
jgi:hypothetical protein